MRVDVQAIDGTSHSRDVTVLAEGYGICNRVPTYPNDSRKHMCIRWDWKSGGRIWFAEHGALGTDDALRTRIARVVAEQKVATDDADIRSRADHMLEQWARQEAAAVTAEAQRVVRVAEAQREREAVYALPLRMRRGDVAVMTDDGMTHEPGMVSSCGTWSVRKDVCGRHVISHNPSGLRLLAVHGMRRARAIVAGVIDSGLDPMSKPDQPALRALIGHLKVVA